MEPEDYVLCIKYSIIDIVLSQMNAVYSIALFY
jgi:hypothetical protein